MDIHLESTRLSKHVKQLAKEWGVSEDAAATSLISSGWSLHLKGIKIEKDLKRARARLKRF